ncbi:class I SAM-dependent methyltransferase, partial [Actinomadura harenae]
GPAAWAAERFGVRPILLEPMPAAGRAAARLFGLPVLAADGARVPLRDGSVDAVWCLGVLDVVPDMAALLREIRRVLRPGGSLGLLVVVAQGRQVLPAPEGNAFPTRRELGDLLAATGFAVLRQIDRPDGTPPSWTRRAERVAAEVASRHRADRALALADRQSERFTRLFAAGQIVFRLVHAVGRPAPRPPLPPVKE